MVENAFGILVSQFRVPLGTMEQRPRVVRDFAFMCVVLHNMWITHQARLVQGSTGHHGAKTKGYQRHLHVWCCTTFRGHTIAGQTGHQPQEMM